MTKKQAQWLYDYVRLVANQFALRDWDFDVEEPEPEDDAFASVCPTYGRKYFRLRVCSNFFTSTLEKQRHTIAHELIHCHMAPAERWIATCADNGKLSNTAIQAFHMNLEYGVDGLADAVASLLPLPPKTTAKTTASLDATTPRSENVS